MFLLVLIAGCGANQRFDTPIPVDDTFTRVPARGEERARYEAAADYSASRDGRAVLVIRGDVVVFETGQNGVPLDAPTPLFSGTKTFACAAAIAAREDGLLALDDPASRWIAGWDDRADITVAHLLHFTSGLRDDRWRLTFDGLRVEQRVADKYAHAVARPVAHAPGTTFLYGAVHLMAFGAVLTEATGTDPLSYLERRVFAPIGMRFSGWNHDPHGNPAMPYGAWTTANEWAKFGVLLRDDGVFGGERVLPSLADCANGSEAQPAYGLGVWLNGATLTAAQARAVPAHIARAGERLVPSAPADTLIAAGAQDQRLYVIPSLDMVVVRLGAGSFRWDDDVFLERLLSPAR